MLAMSLGMSVLAMSIRMLVNRDTARLVNRDTPRRQHPRQPTYKQTHAKIQGRQVTVVTR